ncbi:hybrid sensor histidine kinase/response regulator [Sporosarcina sp. CAU 1771]
MSIFKSKKHLWKSILIVVIFAIILTSCRLLWIKTFSRAEQPPILNGQLDLRGWDNSEKHSITLDGEWEFLPYVSLADEMKNDGKYIEVPGDWSSSLNPETNLPYGFGSYRLRILVDPKVETTYGIRISSIRSASELYVNGLLMGKSGEVGESIESSKTINVPYSSKSIRADENGVIEVVLRVSNYIEPRSSGFVRSAKFGHEEVLASETGFSTLLQITAAVIFFVHALFATLLYVIGIRDKRLLYFALLLITVALTNLMGGDEKVLFEYMPMGYTTSFKLAMVLFILTSWALVQCASPQIQNVSRKFIPIYTLISWGIIALIPFLPMKYLSGASDFVFYYLIVAAIITIAALLRHQKEFRGGIWLALSIIALGSHYLWWAYGLASGVKVIYYPFDLIIAVVCFAGVWFKQYNQMYIDTQNLAAKLQETNKAKDQFLANTSHELRNPLHSILNMSQAVLDREYSSLQERSVRDLETVLTVSRRMSAMVKELLDMTHLKDGNPHLQIQTTSMQAMTTGVISLLDFAMVGRPIRIVNEIPSDFPSVLADENRITQVLFNLLHNAVKFTEQGTIRIQAYIEGDKARIVITDTGIGMDEETLRTIFEPYVQGRNGETMSEGGLGLGLNISGKLVELHGGTLEVESTLGKGTSFSFSLPLGDSAGSGTREELDVRSMSIENQPMISDLPAPEIIRSLSENPPKILVVDDDYINLQVIETILSTEDYSVTTVLSGEEALVLLEHSDWDLVISDVMMPQMSGYELTEKIRERFSLTELPILLLTARSTQKDIEKGFLAGANDYLIKPVDSMELRARVRTLTDVKRVMSEKLRVEAAWLQAQIQPHFLFNALNTVMALSEIDLDRMRDVLGAFSLILRKKFQFSSINELTPIKSEIELVQAYLLIEKERFADRLKVVWKVEDCVDVLIPSLTIQPLVENAIRHGLMKQGSGGQLTIQISKRNEYVEIAVEDNGVGMEKAFVDELFKQTTDFDSGIGLINTNLRLIQRYGKGLEINSTPNVGTIVSFRVPF